MIRRFVLAALILLTPVAIVRAEGLVSTVSNPNVAITSSFDGETLSLFGNVEPDEGRSPVSGPYDVIIVVTGPSVDRVVRRKSNVLGLWVNTEQVEFNPFPTYYQVLASNPLEKITDHKTLVAERILPEVQAQISAVPQSLHVERFGAELVRLMTDRGLFGINDLAVRFLSPTAYAAQLTLPGDISNGLFISQTYLFKHGKLLAKRGDSFMVNKTGFERFLFASAHGQPLLYGVVCALLAVATGWLGGVIFRR
ncbi:MAG TPA: TIGR02186 family protein [Devosiaceae bacterium]|nr:TIGR02186 family protein [Devosiaceae bacterium]